jgi:hypothetical protein
MIDFVFSCFRGRSNATRNQNALYTAGPQSSQDIVVLQMVLGGLGALGG